MAIPAPAITAGGINEMWIRQDWLDSLGLEAPRTWDELVKVAEAFVTQDPDGNGEDDTIGILGPSNSDHMNAIGGNQYGLDPLFSSFQSYPQYWLQGEDGTVEYGSIQPETRDALEKISELYTVTPGKEETVEALSMVSKEKVVFYLVHVPFGIEKMSGEIEGLVETSSNLGILKLGKDALYSTSSVRSSVGSAKEHLSAKLQYLTEFLGGSYEEQGDYPAWEYKKDSQMRDLMVDVYEELFGEKPAVKAIHAGLECGLFYDKIEGLDCVSFGPTMIDIHTTEEKLSIPSTKKMWKYLVRTLEKMNTIQ